MTENVIAQGKTKTIIGLKDGTVLIRSGDAITAGDGAKKDTLDGKAAASTRTTCNVFVYLQDCGIPTHYIGGVSSTEFHARKVDMIPLELVVRRIKTGSHMKRHPEDNEGDRFETLTTEFYYKDDALHDPHVTFNGGNMVLNHADRPIGEDTIIEVRPSPWSSEVIEQLAELAVRVFEALEHAFESLSFDGEAAVLVDFKIECGFDDETGEILVADVIDNDSWRVWLGGKKEGQVDKQVFREIVGEMDPDQRRSLKKLFELVAVTSDQFPEVGPPAAS